MTKERGCKAQEAEVEDISFKADEQSQIDARDRDRRRYAVWALSSHSNRFVIFRISHGSEIAQNGKNCE